MTIEAKDFERCYASKAAGIDSVCGRLSADGTMFNDSDIHLLFGPTGFTR